MNYIKTYVMLVMLAIVFTACSTSGKLMRPAESHPNLESLSVNESTIIVYRGEGSEAHVPLIMMNDRVVGSLLPNRFAQTRACKGTVEIGLADVMEDDHTVHYNPTMAVRGSGNVYLKVVEKGTGIFTLTEVDEATAKRELAPLASESHIINRHMPDCTPAPIAPPPPPPPAPVIVMVDKSAPVVLQRIDLSADTLFKFNKSGLQDMLPKGRIELDKLVKEVKATNLEVEKLRIGGHTDRIGSEGYNLKLSKARAQTVADYLKSHSVTIPMEVIGYGEAEPVTTWCVGEKATPKLIECLQPDRRVTVDLMGQKTLSE